jgi:lipoprotein-anchoring transpeptidase ErfK/SrfK
MEGYGSHGCINLPVDNAASLYDLCSVGDVVVVHY